jgi:hypothetical protein
VNELWVEDIAMEIARWESIKNTLEIVQKTIDQNYSSFSYGTKRKLIHAQPIRSILENMNRKKINNLNFVYMIIEDYYRKLGLSTSEKEEVKKVIGKKMS